MKKALIFLLLPIVLMGCKNEASNGLGLSSAEKEELSIVEKIALANGLEELEDIQTLKYTFNVAVNDSVVSQRSWEWNPKSQEVTFTENDSSFTYNHLEEAKKYPEIDQKFINDHYWLLFPFHLVWDKMEYEHHSNATAPISGENMQQIVVSYPSDAGYTPGDVYEIYFGDDLIVREWVYLSGGSKKDPFATTWEAYGNFKGVNIAKSHKNANGDFEIYFSGISVE